MTSPERPSPPTRSFDNTLAFLKGVSSVPWEKSDTPYDYYPPRPKNQSHKKWVQEYEIAGLYILGNQTQQEIGIGKKLSHQRVSKRVVDVISKLHKTSPLRIQELHPLESFSFKKPKPRKKHSIKDTFSPREEHKKNLQLLLNPNLPKEKVQEILDQVTESEYQSRLKGENRLFISVANTAKKAGLFVPLKEVSSIAEEIKGKGIPVGQVERTLPEKDGRKQTVFRYFFVLSRYENPALHKFRTDADFEKRRRKPVINIGKGTEHVPNTYELTAFHSYRRFGKMLVSKLGCPPRLCNFFIQLLTENNDCPFPLFKYTNGRGNQYYYEAGEIKVVEEFIKKKIKQIA